MICGLRILWAKFLKRILDYLHISMIERYTNRQAGGFIAPTVSVPFHKIFLLYNS